jgi:3'-5' exoribonuclease
MNYLSTLKLYISDYVSAPLDSICRFLIETPEFSTCYGSAGDHHCYPGGLLVHTTEVVEFATDMCQMHPQADDEAVVVAAIFHDFMKIKDYKLSAPSLTSPSTIQTVEKTPYRNLVRHVAGSHAEFVKRTAHLTTDDLSEERHMLIEHLILSHHGRKEWGSPVEPQVVEAYILHYADEFSAKFGPNSKTKPQEI